MDDDKPSAKVEVRENITRELKLLLKRVKVYIFGLFVRLASCVRMFFCKYVKIDLQPWSKHQRTVMKIKRENAL